MGIKYYSDKKWNMVNENNKYWLDMYIKNNQKLSPGSLNQYKNGIQIFFIWVLNRAENKPITDLKKDDYTRYQRWLINNHLGASALKFKKAAVSGLCNFIVENYGEQYPKFYNITKGVKKPNPKKTKGCVESE